MGHRDMIWSRHQPAQLLAWGIRFFLAAALTATQTPGDYAPFALGCVAACGPGAGGIAALLGAGVGAVLFLDFSGALPFLAAAILIFTTAAAFQGLKLLEGPLFHPLAGAGLFLAVSGIYVLQSLSPLRNLAPCLAATALVGISAWYYQPLLQAGGERPEPDSLLFLAGSILLALVDVELAGVSVGRTSGIYLRNGRARLPSDTPVDLRRRLPGHGLRDMGVDVQYSPCGGVSHHRRESLHIHTELHRRSDEVP